MNTEVKKCNKCQKIKRIKARELCSRCYQQKRWSKSITFPKSTLILKRIEGRLQLAKNGCIEYIGARNTDGYGTIRYKNKTYSVHKLYWILKKGLISPGLCVLHHCDNPPCCNLEHLWVGTHKDNINDRQRKGRSRGRGIKGENHYKAKLTNQQAEEIRQLRKEGKLLREIAIKFNMSQAIVSVICANKRYMPETFVAKKQIAIRVRTP